MNSSKKAGLAIEEVVGMLTVMFVAALFIFGYYQYESFKEEKKQKQVEIYFEDIDINYNLNRFLGWHLEDNRIVADLINEAIIKNDYRQLKKIADGLFNDIYTQRGLKYDLIINSKSLNSVVFIKKTARNSIKIPTFDKQVQEVELIVGR